MYNPKGCLWRSNKFRLSKYYQDVKKGAQTVILFRGESEKKKMMMDLNYSDLFQEIPVILNYHYQHWVLGPGMCYTAIFFVEVHFIKLLKLFDFSPILKLP